MSLAMVFGLLGGLGLFIYGMKQMSEGLQKAAGRRLKQLLNMLTTNRFAGVIVGTAVTAIIQSSSATTVMVVGFVNAGLMNLTQSIGVIMGANIGTTITAQLIAFKLSHYALHAVAIGAAFYLFSKSDRFKYLGQIILGFGILFLGLTIMKETMEPLRDSPVFVEYMRRFGTTPILGLAMGTTMTIVLQSSSASIGILMSMVAVGIVDYQMAIPILLGGNIGTTITAILSSIGTNRAAKRAAAAHMIFNVIGAGVIVLLLHIFPGFSGLINKFMMSISNLLGHDTSQVRLLANTHTVFNIVNTLVWLPFVGGMSNLVKRILPGEDISIKRGLSFLDERMLETPSLVIEQLRAEVLRMFDLSVEMVKDAALAFREGDSKAVTRVDQKEEVVNELEEELVVFLTKFPRSSMSEGDVRTVDMYYAIIDDVESIADDAYDIAEMARYKGENKIVFSDEAWETIKGNFNLILNLLDDTHEMIEAGRTELAEGILEGEQKMDDYLLEYRSGHLERLGRGVCAPEAGIVYLEVLDSMEHISDQMADITHSIVEVK